MSFLKNNRVLAMNYTNVYYHFRKHLLNLKTSFGKGFVMKYKNKKRKTPLLLNVNELIRLPTNDDIPQITHIVFNKIKNKLTVPHHLPESRFPNVDVLLKYQ